MSRVLHLHLHPRRTGITRHVESIVAALENAEEVGVFGTSLASELPRWSLGRLWRFLRAGPGIIHAHRNLEIVLGLLLRALGRGIRLVATRHAAPRPSALTRLLLRQVDLRISLTDEMAAALGSASEVVGHGVDLERFSPPADRAVAFAALGLQGRGAAGVVGRVRASKGQGDFIEAWRRLDPTLASAWTPVLVGAVRPADRVLADAFAGLVPNLVQTGEVADVTAWLRGLTVVVQPSRSEGFSLVLLEAMACGACVVAARLPHFERGIITHGQTGFLYEPGDVDALRELLSALIQEPERALDVGRRAAEHARAHFGIRAEADHLRALYERLLGASR